MKIKINGIQFVVQHLKRTFQKTQQQLLFPETPLHSSSGHSTALNSQFNLLSHLHRMARHECMFAFVWRGPSPL